MGWGRGSNPIHPGHIRTADQIIKILATGLITGVSENPLGTRVPLKDTMGGIKGYDGIRGVVEHRFEIFLTFDELFLYPVVFLFFFFKIFDPLFQFFIGRFSVHN